LVGAVGRHTADVGSPLTGYPEKAETKVAFTIFGMSGIVGLPILALIIAALVFVVRRA
jgi:hypothetical protein